jgi:DNA replication protein DnaC
MAQPYAELATQAAQKMWPHVDYLASLLEGEANMRQERATTSRLRRARFPVIKTLEPFRWDWPTRSNRLQGQHHFHLAFLKAKAHLLFLGGVGLGKPQPGNYPSRLQCITGTHHHRP